VACLALVVGVVVEVHPCLCATSESVDSWLCHFGKEGSGLFDFPEPLPVFFLSQPAFSYARDTQQPASSLLELGRVDSCSVVVFS